MRTEFLGSAQSYEQDPLHNVQQNLAELDARLAAQLHARAFWLGELIASLDQETLLDRDRLLLLCEQLLAENETQDCYAQAMHAADLFSLCNELAARFPAGYEQAFAALFGEHESFSPDAQGRVAYVANSYTEQAFMELTGFIKQRRVAYFHGFEDVCQEVRSGLCEYGILPVESTKEGLMAGLWRLIELYDLRICALCYVPTPQSGSTAFALVRRHLSPTPSTQHQILDILLSPASPTDTGNLIATASLGGHALLHAATYEGQDGEQMRLQLAIYPAALYPFLLYLLLFCADVTPIGYYTIK